ncbi:MAG TPA: response regulator [Gammaproteobacteria bacterium]|nr:response regulator [Gammaproteobacteria bacterium]
MNRPHILVVDDHRDMRQIVGQILETEGYRVTTAANGKDMQRLLNNEIVDLIVLDLMMPGEDGLTLCRKLRSEASSVPVIILTAKGDEIDRVVGLEMGADDYVAKPFSGRELVARIRAVLRRTQGQGEPSAIRPRELYRFGKWVLDTARRELELDGDILVPLSSGEYDLLLVFVRHPQRVLSRDQLLDRVKGRTAVPLDRSIDLQVSRLRRKIGDDARNPQVIKTVRGGGYVFTLPVTTQ